jgi:cell division protein FtsN
MAKEQPVAQKKDDKEATPQSVVPLENNSDDISKEDASLEAQKKSVAVKEKPKDDGKPKAKETPASASTPKQKFIIQVASLKEKNKAYQLNKKIAELGFEALIVPIDIKGKGTWYRVTVSGFESKAQAQAAAVKISKKTGTNCIIKSADSNVTKN